MIHYPTKLVEAAQPLPGSVPQTILQAKGLYVMQGLDTTLAQQLIDRSREPHIVEYCPKDAGMRFSNMAAIEAWQQKGRFTLPLVKKLAGNKLQLVGFGWFGPKKPKRHIPYIKEMEPTFSIRLYKEALGQGNALPYTQVMLAAHQVFYGAAKYIWLTAWDDNLSALKVYQKAGFKKVAEAHSQRQGKKLLLTYMVWHS